MTTPDLFRARMDSMIDMHHPLAALATRMPWAQIEASLAHKDRQGRTVQDVDPNSTVLRSKTPELVQQELWGLLLAHFAIRQLMVQAAWPLGLDPDRLSRPCKTLRAA